MNRQSAFVALAVVLLFVLSVAAMFAWLASRPAWQLSARNSPDGVILEVYKANQNKPTYSTLLEGRTIDRDIDRVARQDLPPEVGTTTFHDETLRPGRWTLVLDGTEVDIMERALILDGETEIMPSN